ncbi:MAG TPA: MFS transporter [Candidatus Alistipes intestinigallinarum]|uniref:MFS transporter n=1 Tax=Candidatus Alistipes intestinigallinarum TaxID=2838440 RepID=A0A9D1Z313_9BACT|nr:MFS transporter [Candidatus Alistipes intestinigallinarum]
MEMKTSGRAQGRISMLLPVLFCFFIMGFVDIVGTAVANIKDVLGLSSTMAGLLPNFIFIWFLFCSIPAGMLMRRYGRKRMVLVSNLITCVAMLLPLVLIFGVAKPGLDVYIPVFVLMGVGNTIIQVALNPLLTNVVSGDRLASAMTLGQFVKALSSLLGPQIVLFASVWLGDWNYVFPIYAILTILSSVWLFFTPIPREASDPSGSATFGGAFGLLRDGYLLLMFLVILLIVGVDVGLNFFIPEIFREVFAAENPASMNTLYFGARALGSFVCAMLLVRFSARKIFVWTMVVAIAAYLWMMFLAGSAGTASARIIFILLFLPVGFATGNVFSIAFSFAMQHRPEKADLISSLLIMGVAGGGAVTLVTGALSDALGILGGMSVLLVCLLFIFGVSLYAARR